MFNAYSKKLHTNITMLKETDFLYTYKKCIIIFINHKKKNGNKIQ